MGMSCDNDFVIKCSERCMKKKMLQTFLRAGTRCHTTSCNFLMQWFAYCLNDGAHTISPKELWWKEHLEKDDKTKLKF